MKKVIALSWDKLFLSCSQFESKLAKAFNKTDMLSGSFSKNRSNGTTGSNRISYMSEISIADKFNFDEVCERFAYLEKLLNSGYALVIVTQLHGHGSDAVKDILKEQGFSIPVIVSTGNFSRAKSNFKHDIYINYDWFKMMPVIVTGPDFYLVKSAMFVKKCLFKAKQLLPTRNSQSA